MGICIFEEHQALELMGTASHRTFCYWWSHCLQHRLFLVIIFIGIGVTLTGTIRSESLPNYFHRVNKEVKTAHSEKHLSSSLQDSIRI